MLVDTWGKTNESNRIHEMIDAGLIQSEGWPFGNHNLKMSGAKITI